jgi:hypothetical protein
VGALLLWLAARWLRWFLTSRPVFVDGDAYGVRLHAKSPVFLARLRDALPDAPAAADTDEGVAALDRAHPPYLPLAGAATALTVLLFAGVVAALAGLVSTSAQISLLLGDTIDKIPAAVVAASDQRDRLVGIMQLATFAAGGIAFLFWLHRARRNLASLGARGLAYSPGLAVAYWFIPLSNLCRPFDVMVETWKASGPSQPGTEAWRFAPLGSVLKSWWILFLVSNLLGTLTFTLSMNLGVFAGRPSPLTFGLLVVSWVRLASDLAAVASVALLIVIVQTISRRQDEARQRLVHIG